MPRPVKKRVIHHRPACYTFGPMCKSEDELEKITLYADHIEALRLADLEGMSHDDAAGIMNVSRQTFGRIIEEARAIVTEAIVSSKAIEMACGENIKFAPKNVACGDCSHEWQILPKNDKTVVLCPECKSDNILKTDRCGSKCNCSANVNQYK